MEKIKILLIEDNIKSIEQIKKKISNNRYHILSAHSQKSAELIIRTESIKICLIELNVEDQSGLKICRELKDLDSLLKIIVMTDNPDHESAVEAMRNGAFDFIVKNLKKDQLLTKIENALNFQESESNGKENDHGHGIILICHHAMIKEGFENFCKTYPEYKLLQDIHSIEFIKTNNFNLNTRIVLICETCNDLCSEQPEKFFPQLKRLFPKGMFIMINSNKNDEEKKRLIKVGVRGFLSKNIFRVNMEKAFRSILKGQVWVSRRITDSLLNDYLTREKLNYTPYASPYKLSKRELEVLQIISSGLTNLEVSEKLFISEKTVKAHLGNVFKKLGVKSRTQAIKKVVEEHII